MRWLCGVEPCDIRAILRPLGAIDLADGLYFVVVTCICITGELRWRAGAELGGAFDAERLYI